MNYSPNVWNQLKNITADELIAALKKDGWYQDESVGAVLVFIKENPKKRITIHYHPKKTYQAKLLKGLLEIIGWEEKRMRELKLIK